MVSSSAVEGTGQAEGRRRRGGGERRSEGMKEGRERKKRLLRSLPPPVLHRHLAGSCGRSAGGTGAERSV
eukprot:767721-Hanusia_phi.AAC.1